MTSVYHPYKKPSGIDLNLITSNEYNLSDANVTYTMREWYSNLVKECTDPMVAATITLKQRIRLPNTTYQQIDDIEIKKLLRRLHRKVNREVFGVSAKRHKLKVFMLPALEGGKSSGKRFHIHLIVGVPEHYNLDRFVDWFKKILINEHWVYTQIQAEPMYGDLWQWYITKQGVDPLLFQPETPRHQEMSF